MDTNIAAWMIAGGPRIELDSTQRDREHLYALRESQQADRATRPSFFQRLRGITASRQTETDLACCPA